MAPEALPVLETPRLRLRPRTLADSDACYRLDCEPGTLRYVDWPRHTGRWEDEAAHRTFIVSRTLNPYQPGLGYWAATREDPDAFLGWVQLIPENARGPEIEIGWRLLTAARGRGYATEAARALLTHGFGTAGVRRVVADMYRANAPSMNVCRKLGFRQVADPKRTNGDYVLWVLDREDWWP
jgi:RimJ/RimL family protein N-acetyltransferase